MPTNDEKRKQDYLESKQDSRKGHGVQSCGLDDPEAVPENLCNVQDIEE